MNQDLRLVAPALAGWISSALVQQVPVARQAPLAWAIVLVAAASAVAALGWLDRRHGYVVAVAIACGIASLAAGAASAMYVTSLTAEPVHRWSQARLSADVVGVVSTPLTSQEAFQPAVWQPERTYEQFVATSRVTVRGSQVDVEVPLLLRLASPDLAAPVGTEVRMRGRLLPAGLDRHAAAILVLDTAPERLSAPGAVDAVADAMRRGLLVSLSGLPPQGASLVAGRAVGDESLQPTGLSDAMRASGLAHLTAVSGGNTAIVCGAVLALGALLRLGVSIRALAAGVVLAFYVVLVGPQPSVLRAAAMGGVTLTAMVLGGRRSGVAALCFSVLTLVMMAPGLATSWGFVLSVMATAGLILLAPFIDSWLATRRWMWRCPSAVRLAVAVTLAAQLSTLPVLLLMGSATGWVSVPANLMAMPAVVPVTVIGLLDAVVAPLSPQLAELLAHIAYAPAAWIAIVAETTSQWPMAQLPVPQGWVGVAILGALLLMLVLGTQAIRRTWPHGVPRATKVIAGVAAIALVVTTLVYRERSKSWPPDDWLLIACDVGQGDALLLRSGVDSAVVVDVGPDGRQVNRCLAEAGVHTVDAIILTHDHADHVVGTGSVLDAFDVPVLFTGPLADPPEQHRTVLDAAHRAGTAVTVAMAGEVRRVGELTWRVIWPRRIITAGSVPNNSSIVLVATIQGRELLLAGDIEPEAQAAISADLRDVHPVTVKVPHHGSKYQHEKFPAWAKAPFAIISVGAGNDYGHPSEDTIGAWRAVGSDVARTDRDGDVAIVAVGTSTSMVRRGR